MGDDQGPGGSGLIVYIDRSDIREGRADDLRAGIRRLVEVIESKEPQLISYGFHFADEAGRMTVVAVHPDSAQIEVYGSISDKAMALLEQKATMRGGKGIMVHPRFAGFDHPQASEAD